MSTSPIIHSETYLIFCKFNLRTVFLTFNLIGFKPVLREINEMWQLLDSGKKSAQRNMDLDAKLLEKMHPDDSPLLHFYDWERDSITHGFFVKPEKHLSLKKLKKLNIDLAGRPTGGGLVFHLFDLAFSVLVPANFPQFSTNTLDNYHFINNRVKRAIKRFIEKTKKPFLLPKESHPLNEHCKYFCMANPTRYDVMIDGKKVAGAAQRRRKQGYLHQGSIALACPKKNFLDTILLSDTKVKEAMFLHTFSLLKEDYRFADLEEMRYQMRHFLKAEFMGDF